MAALRGRNLNLLRRRTLIAEAVVDVIGHAVFGTPKNHQRRQVPLTRFLAEELAVHLAGKAPGDFVFAAERGRVLHSRNFRRSSFDPAVRATGLAGLAPHALRHTAASLAKTAAGRTSRWRRRCWANQSATMTLDPYGDLLADQLDEVADAMDAARAAGAAARLAPRPVAAVPALLQAENTTT